MKKVEGLFCGSPSVALENMKGENQRKIELAKQVIREIENFLEQYKIYLAVLGKVQSVLESEKIE